MTACMFKFYTHTCARTHAHTHTHTHAHSNKTHYTHIYTDLINFVKPAS